MPLLTHCIHFFLHCPCVLSRSGYASVNAVCFPSRGESVHHFELLINDVTVYPFQLIPSEWPVYNPSQRLISSVYNLVILCGSGEI